MRSAGVIVMQIFVFFAVPPGVLRCRDDIRGPRWQISSLLSTLVMKPRRMETGQSGSGSSHLFLIQRREQIDFSQKVVCDSDSQCRGDSNGLRSVEDSLSRRSFRRRLYVSPVLPSFPGGNLWLPYWVMSPTLASEHRKWTSNLRENNDLSFIPFLALHKCSPLWFFFFYVCFLKGLGWLMGV